MSKLPNDPSDPAVVLDLYTFRKIQNERAFYKAMCEALADDRILVRNKLKKLQEKLDALGPREVKEDS
jgi:hypothetical protein